MGAGYTGTTPFPWPGSFLFFQLWGLSHATADAFLRITPFAIRAKPLILLHPTAASHCLASGNTEGQALALTFCALAPAAPGGGNKDRGKDLSWGDAG